VLTEVRAISRRSARQAISPCQLGLEQTSPRRPRLGYAAGSKRLVPADATARAILPFIRHRQRPHRSAVDAPDQRRLADALVAKARLRSSVVCWFVRHGTWSRARWNPTSCARAD